MKKSILCFFTLLAISHAFSQKLHFIYLQSDPQQPFFARIDDNIHSSSSSGYLIISRLKDTVNDFSIGFPENKWPEQKFRVDLKGKDRGYLLKNFGANGWGLYDLESASVQMAAPPVNQAVRTEMREVSLFTEILSKAANDPSLKERPVTVKEGKAVTQPVAVVKQAAETARQVDVANHDSALTAKTEPPAIKQADEAAAKKDEPMVKKEEPLVKKEDPALKKEEPVTKKEETVVKTDEPKVKNDEALAKKEEPVVKKEENQTLPATEYRRSVVTRVAETSVSDGFGLTFIDDYGNGKKDTVRILIPNPKRIFAETKEQPREEKKFLDITTNDTLEQKVAGRKEEKKEEKPVVSIVKDKCASIASDNDFLKLRKKMAGETNDDAMVDEARKFYKAKCFTSTQVKNLGALFLNDEGKYKFFDASYDRVSDKENFPALVSELKDEYYINRFKAMLR